jgi:hypothetical protein
LPSGWMLMSQAAMSASFNGLPRPGPSARAAPANQAERQPEGQHVDAMRRHA